MQVIGYKCLNNFCSCDYSASVPTNSNITFCGSLDWNCRNNTDCRSTIGLYCESGECSCESEMYFDRNNSRCSQLIFNYLKLKLKILF